MYFVLLYQNAGKLVRHKASATSSEVHTKAFGFDSAGDPRSPEVQSLSSSRSLKKARDAAYDAWRAGKCSPHQEVL